jgi:putative oxidoreductase
MSTLPLSTIDTGGYGALALRLALGTMWISHALLKWFVFTIPGFAQWLETQGLPSFAAWPIFLAELLGGSAIVLGLHGRWISASLVPVLLVAAWTHFPNGWVHTSPGGGWEYPIFLTVASVTHALIGDGVYALASSRVPKLRQA